MIPPVEQREQGRRPGAFQRAGRHWGSGLAPDLYPKIGAAQCAHGIEATRQRSGATARLAGAPHTRWVAA